MKLENTTRFESQSPYRKPPEPKAERYIAISLLISLVSYIMLESYIFISGNNAFFPFFLVLGKNYPPGTIPNSGIGGGWSMGPLFFHFITLGFLCGWMWYKIKKAVFNRKRKL
jgi:hypothetical protein